MIVVTRLHGSVLALNCDLIERVEATPRTILTMVDGSRYVVRESVAEIVDKVRAFRASVIALAHAEELARERGSHGRGALGGAVGGSELPPHTERGTELRRAPANASSQYRNMGLPSTWRTRGR
jgi:flagellar protein FlbD